MYKKIDKYITGLILDSEDVIISVAHTQPWMGIKPDKAFDKHANGQKLM